MNKEFDNSLKNLRLEGKTWLITGVAGFIGSNLLETLLSLDQKVKGLDNLSTGYLKNLENVKILVTPAQWSRFSFISGDIRNIDDCRQACNGVDYVLHHAALGSVPRSIEDPIETNSVNISGFLNMLIAARDAQVGRFIYAASSSTYGDHPGLPKIEKIIGRPLSPYAITKYVNELYADIFHRVYGVNTIGLRYFNVFGPRQDPEGAYAAVIPRWINNLIINKPIYINGDGETSRDFCYIDNVKQINILAATTTEEGALNQVYNVAAGKKTTLNQLYNILSTMLKVDFNHIRDSKPVYCDFRSGDVRHSLADISKASRFLGYEPTHDVNQGLQTAIKWYVNNVSAP